MIRKISNLFGASVRKDVRLSTDLHSHLIPGIDDGAKTMEESLDLIRALTSFGYRKLVTTPHIMSHRFPNSADTILHGLDRLREAVEREKIDVEIDAASEYYLDEHFESLLAQKALLTFGGNRVLFEMSYVIAPPKLEHVIFEMQSAGYTPVLAHPERYLFMHADFEKYADLKARNVEFQVNINSLGGYYSKPVQKAAHQIMKKGWIDFLGSDTHHQRHIDAFAKTVNAGVIEKVSEKNTLLNNVL